MTETVTIMRDGENVEVPAETVIVPPTLPEAKAQRLAELADIRWQHEVGGITFVYGGQPVPIPTDRPDQAQAFIAKSLSEGDPDYTRKIKVMNGLFIEADADTIIAVAGLIDAHVQTCFDKEATLTALILAASTVEAVQAIDITTGWPG